MSPAPAFLRRRIGTLGASFLILLLTAVIELKMGRSALGPDGRFGWWERSIWSAENSQRLADAYSFSHVVHGVLFYALFHWLARRVPLEVRFLTAVVLEAVWEILENSPFIIDRYRSVTIAIGYVGDSVLNSCSDIVVMALGFLFASFAPVWLAVAAVLAMEVGCLFWVRDNLTLNILMLVHPVDFIRRWQLAGHTLR